MNQVKGFSTRKGRSAEVLLVIGEKAETTQTIRTYAAVLLDMHNVPAGEEVPCLVPEEARTKAAVAVLPGSGGKT